MARARPGFLSQPESTVMQVRFTSRADRLAARAPNPTVYGEGDHYGHLSCGHGILRLRRPKVGQCVVCWACATRPQLSSPVVNVRHR